MKQAVVGIDVGFCVGYRGLPDCEWPSGINRLGRVCRKCRVFSAGETARDFGHVDFDDIPPVGNQSSLPQAVHTLGLE